MPDIRDLWGEDEAQEARIDQAMASDPMLEPDSLGTELMTGLTSAVTEYLPAAALNAVQAPTLGFFDELTSPFQWGRDLEEFRQEQRETYPLAGDLAEVSGGLLTGLRAGPAVANFTGQLKNPLLRAGANLGLAGVAGGLYGYGGGTTEEERESGAMGGAATGVAIPPILSAGARVGSAIFEPILDWGTRMYRGDAHEALKDLGRRQADEGVPMDADALARRQFDAEVTEGAPFINADLDPASAQRLKELYDQSPQARESIETFLSQRQRSAPERTVNNIADITGMDRDTRKMINEINEANRKQMARENYDELYQGTAELNDELLDMFLGPEGDQLRRAYKKAEQIAAREGDPIPSYNTVFGEDGTLEALPVKAIDYMGRVFRNAGKPNIANPQYDHVSWRKLRERFLNAADQEIEGFREARKLYATQMSLEDALEQGRDIYKLGDARDIAEFMETLSEPELKAFRRGAVDAMESQIRNLGFKSGNVDTRVAGTQNKSEIIDLVFGENADAVRAILQREDIYNRTYSQVLGGSLTSKNLRGGMPDRGMTEYLRDRTKTAFQGDPSRLYRDQVELLMSRGYTDEQARVMARQEIEALMAERFGRGAAGAGIFTLSPSEFSRRVGEGLSGWLEE